jgi:hypothetical protein
MREARYGQAISDFKQAYQASHTTKDPAQDVFQVLQKQKGQHGL